MEIPPAKGSLKAKLNIHFRDKKETKEKGGYGKSGDDLFDKSGGVEVYRHGYIVNGLDAEDEMVAFSNGFTNQSRRQSGRAARRSDESANPLYH